MGFTTSNLSLYHTFSKTPVDSNTNSAAAQLGNAINKSGHTVQSNEIWTESIPFFGLAATTTAIHTKFSSTAKVNDLVKDSDGKIWQRNSTVYSTSATFDNLWSEKTKSITSFTKGADGEYTFTEAEGALVDGSYLLNSEGVPTVKYYEKRLLTRLTADNNANTNSDNKASRLQIDGKWIDQFIGVTDIYLNGSAAVSYAPVLRKTSSSSPMQAGPGKGYMDYCATGLILWESSAAGTEVIDCFEYVGAKLNSTVAKLEAAVFGGSSGGGGEEDISISEQVAKNTIAINVLNGADTVEGSVAKTVKDAIDNLGDVAVKSDITITDIKVKQGSGEAESLTITDKSVTIEIPEVPAAVVTEAGAVTTDGFTKTADVTNLANAAIKSAISDTEGAIAEAIDGAISDATLPSGDNAIQSATSDADTKLVTVEQVKEYVTENAQVTVTDGTTDVTATGFKFTGSTGDDITISSDLEEVTETDGTKTGKVTYSATLSKATVGADGGITFGYLAVSATDAKTIADKAIETALTDTANGSLGATIASKVADVTVNGTSIVDATDKVAKLTTTEEAEIVSSTTTSTKLATEVSVAKSVKTLEGKIDAITAGDGSIGSRLEAVEGTANSAIQTVTAPGAEKNDTTVTITAATLNTDNKSFANDGYFVKASDVVTVATTIAAEKIASIETTGTAEIEANAESTSTKLATEASVAKSVKTLEGKVTTLEGTEITQQSVSGAGITVTLDGTVGTPTLTGSVTTASYTPATKTTAGSWSEDTKVAKASDVKAAIADVETAHGKDIQTLQATVNGLTTTGLTREVLPDDQTTDDIENPKENVIYLVKDKDDVESGSYIEYLYVGTSFEPIGTTKTDLSEYAKTADVNASIEDINTEVAKKANSTDVYTKTEIDDKVTTINGAIEAAAAKGQQGIDDAATAKAAADAAQADATQALTNAATAQAAADAAQGEVDDLEGVVSALSQVVADNKTAAEAAIALKADQTALDATNTTVSEHTTAIETLNSTTIPAITDRLDAIPTAEVVAAEGTIETPNYVTVSSSTTDGKTTFTVASTGALETRLDTLESFIGGSDTPGQGLSELLAKKVDNVTGSSNGITIATADTTDGRVATLAVSADTTVTENSTNVVTSDAVWTAISNSAGTTLGSAKSYTEEQVGALKTAATGTVTADNTAISVTQTDAKVTAIEVTKGAIADKDTNLVDGGTVYAVTSAIETRLSKVETAADTGVDSKITTAIEALDATPSGNGITVTQVDGVITAVAAAAGEVAENSTDVVTGGVVYTAIKAVSDLIGTTAVATQISNAIATLDSTTSGNGITVTLTDGKVTTVSAAAGTVAEGDTNVVTGGVVYTAIEEVKAIAEAKISAVQSDSTHFGSPLVTTSGTTVTVSPAKEWSVGTTKPASTITFVINGKMSDGSTIDDANLTNGTSMFANNTALTTYVGDLGKLTTGTSMFSGCTALTTFCGNLGSLTDGTDMFAGCKLTEESLMYIADSLPQLTDDSTAIITLGTMDGDGMGDFANPTIKSLIQEIEDKKWDAQYVLAHGGGDN